MKKESNRTLIPAAFAIERRSASKANPSAPKHVTDHITALLHAELKHLTAGLEAHAEPASKAVRTFGGFGSAAALERHVAEWRANQLFQPSIMDLQIPLGVRVVGPPYDHSWATGAGLPLSRIDGTMTAFGGDDFSASGASIILSSPTPALVSVTPMGTYSFNWSSFENYPTLLSRGGLGILAYANGNPNPVVTRQAVLWSVSGVSQFTGNGGSGNFADAIALQTTFGPVHIAPVLFNMNPSDSYEVWMWCWQVGHNQSGTAFLSVVQCKIPLILIDAGPPIVIR